MITPQDIMLILFGIIACFMGYSMFRSMLPLWGFLLGGWIAFTLAPGLVNPQLGDQMIFRIIVFVIGGLIGAILSFPLYFAIIFLSGAALGMMLGVMVGTVFDVGGVATVAQVNTLTSMAFPPVPHTMMQFVMAAIGALLLGMASVGFQKFMVIASSSFMGAAALISGLNWQINQMSSTTMGRGAVMMLGFLFIGMIGIFVQYRLTGEV